MFITGIVRWWKYRGTHVITCPENHNPVAVRVGAMQSADGVRLKSCTRWPEKEGCAQDCVPQLEAAPRTTLVQAIAADWYVGKNCAFCQEPIGEIVWHERPPALIAEDGTSREWKEVAPQDLPSVLATHKPLCFKCFVAASFEHDHPEWVIERPRVSDATHTLEPSTAVY